MKKKLILMTLLLSAASLTACSSDDKQSRETSDKTSAENAVPVEEWVDNVTEETAAQLFTLTSDDAFLEAIASSSEIEDMVSGWRGVSLNTDEIYVIDISEKNVDLIVSDVLSMNTDNISEPARKKIIDHLGSTIPTLLMSYEGTVTVAAHSIMQYSETYAVNYDMDDQIRLIATDNEELSVCVSFIKTGKGVISVNASYMPHTGKSLEETTEFLKDMKLPVDKLD